MNPPDAPRSYTTIVSRYSLAPGEIGKPIGERQSGGTPTVTAESTKDADGGLPRTPCSADACPICGEPLWFYDCWRSCPKCDLEFPDALEDRIEKAKEDEWGLYAFYGRLDELKGRRVKPARDAKHPNFTEDEHVIVSEVHPPNSVRISYRDGFSVGLRGLSELNLSSLQNDKRLAHADENQLYQK